MARTGFEALGCLRGDFDLAPKKAMMELVAYLAIWVRFAVRNLDADDATIQVLQLGCEAWTEHPSCVPLDALVALCSPNILASRLAPLFGCLGRDDDEKLRAGMESTAQLCVPDAGWRPRDMRLENMLHEWWPVYRAVRGFARCGVEQQRTLLSRAFAKRAPNLILALMIDFRERGKARPMPSSARFLLADALLVRELGFMRGNEGGSPRPSQKWFRSS